MNSPVSLWACGPLPSQSKPAWPPLRPSSWRKQHQSSLQHPWSRPQARMQGTQTPKFFRFLFKLHFSIQLLWITCCMYSSGQKWSEDVSSQEFLRENGKHVLWLSISKWFWKLMLCSRTLLPRIHLILKPISTWRIDISHLPALCLHGSVMTMTIVRRRSDIDALTPSSKGFLLRTCTLTVVLTLDISSFCSIGKYWVPCHPVALIWNTILCGKALDGPEAWRSETAGYKKIIPR